MSYQTLLVERAGDVGTITINRPKQLNALNAAVLKELTQALRELGRQGECRAIILTGGGEKAFVAGADIAELEPMSPWQAREFSERGHVATALLEDLPCATIAAVHGYALGGGCELAVSCDLIYASETARFGQPEVNLGVTPGFGGSQRLVRLIGKIRAKEMIFTGDMYDARKAHDVGLCLDVLPTREALMAHCHAVAEKIATKGPLAVARAKRLVERGYDIPLRSANSQEAETFALLFDTADRKEGMQAFLEKRAPKYLGK